MRNNMSRFLLLAVAPALGLLLGGCQNESRSPTEPAVPSSVSSSAAAAVTGDGATAPAGSDADGTTPEAAVAAARKPKPGGNGNGNGNGGNGNGGNGNGNGGNGGGRGNGGGGALALQMQPDAWNTNWEHSEGVVSALVRGGDAREIDRESVELACEGGEVIEPERVQLAGGQLRAFFAKSDAIECLDEPAPREVHEVTMRFTVDGGAVQELTADVRIVGPPGGGDDEDDTADEVNAQVQPNTWNVNWVHAQGTVSILLMGDITDIDEDTIVLVGSADIEVEPVGVKRVGNHIRARFPMDEAFESLDEPEPGETHEIKVKFLDDAAASHEITLRVRIVGPR